MKLPYGSQFDDALMQKICNLEFKLHLDWAEPGRQFLQEVSLLEPENCSSLSNKKYSIQISNLDNVKVFFKSILF